MCCLHICLCRITTCDGSLSGLAIIFSFRSPSHLISVLYCQVHHSWLMSPSTPCFLHEREGLTMLWLFGTCLHWNNLDLLALHFPGTFIECRRFHYPCCCLSRHAATKTGCTDFPRACLPRFVDAGQSMQESVNDKSF